MVRIIGWHPRRLSRFDRGAGSISSCGHNAFSAPLEVWVGVQDRQFFYGRSGAWLVEIGCTDADSIAKLEWKTHRQSIGLHWTPLDSIGLHCSPVDSIGRHWIPLDSIGLHWTPSDSIGFHWTPLDSTGLHWTPLDAIGL